MKIRFELLLCLQKRDLKFSSFISFQSLDTSSNLQTKMVKHRVSQSQPQLQILPKSASQLLDSMLCIRWHAICPKTRSNYSLSWLRAIHLSMCHDNSSPVLLHNSQSAFFTLNHVHLPTCRCSPVPHMSTWWLRWSWNSSCGCVARQRTANASPWSSCLYRCRIARDASKLFSMVKVRSRRVSARGRERC